MDKSSILQLRKIFQDLLLDLDSDKETLIKINSAR